MQRPLNLVRSILFAVAVVCTVFRVPAQQTVRSVDYARTLWKVPDGLPEDTVQALVEGRDGSLWLGTTGGLAKTGGGQVRTPYETSSVSALVSVRDGSIWIGTEGGGLLHLPADHILRLYSSAQGLANGFVRALFQDSRGQLWIGTDRGLFFLRDDRLQYFDLHEDGPRMSVNAIAEDSVGSLWVGGSQLIRIDRHYGVQHYSLSSGNALSTVYAVLHTKADEIWLGTSNGLAKVVNGTVRPAGHFRAPVRAMLQASDGTIWVGTLGTGLWTVKGDQWTRWRNPGLLPSETILSLLQDHFGQIWIGTHAGLVRLEHSPLTLLSLPGSAELETETLSINPDGNIWIAARNLYQTAGQNVRKMPSPIPGTDIRMTLRTSDGSLWLGTGASGVYRVRNGVIQHLTAPGQLPSDSIRAMLQASDGSIWVATDQGVAIVSANGTRVLSESDGLSYMSTRTVFEDRSHIVWIGTDRGLNAWRNGQLIRNEPIDALSHEKVWSILQDRAGSLWFGTREHGLYRFRSGMLTHYTTEEGLPTNSIYKVVQDQGGTFWISGPNIIFSLQEQELALAGAPTTPLNPVLYAIPSEGVQMFGGVEPAGLVAQDGTIYFPSNRGIAHIDVAQLRPTPWKPRINEITDDGHVTAIRTSEHLPATSMRLTYRLAAVYLRPQDTVRFRYRMEGLETTWAQIRPGDSITYTNLRAGHYRLRIQAIDFAIPGADAETIVDIEKSRFFYDTWWFYILCVAAVAALVWLIHRVRMQQVNSRFAAVLQERARLAREMHDTVVQSCTGLSVLLEAAKNASSDSEEQQELLDHARELTKTTVDQARQAVWAMRHGPESEVDLVETLELIAEQAQKSQKGTVVAVEAKGKICVSSSLSRELIMTIREAVFNALQHSGTTRIVVRAAVSRDELSLEIEDYGVGLDEKAATSSGDGHYGILGMRERIGRIGGSIEFLSSPGRGTKVRIFNLKISAFEVGAAR